MFDIPNQKVMYVDESPKMPIVSGGVLIYRFVNSKLYFLILDNIASFCDLGGCISNDDQDIYDTIIRNVKKISENKIILTHERLQLSQRFYVQERRHVVFVMSAIDSEFRLKLNEIHTQNLKWIPLSILKLPLIFKHKLHFRIKSKFLLNYLDKINDEIISKNCIFTHLNKMKAKISKI